MEAIYYVISWPCHRKCAHCYDDRFRPYHGSERIRLLEETRSTYPKVIENLPERMTYLDMADPAPDGSLPTRRGRVILAGGEVLLKYVREPILYPAMRLIHDKYKGNGGADIVVQTTGDLVTDRIIVELLENHVDRVIVSGMDAYHEGLESPEARERLRDKLTSMFEAHGMKHQPQTETQSQARAGGAESTGPFFSFYGAVPGSWIGELWPRGRAHENEISTATLATNFCARRSGGIDFLQYRHNGSKVSIEPNGFVYPCCMKTKAPIGNAANEPVEQILARLTGNPVYEAISMGRPERMGLNHGWTVDKFIEKSTVRLPSGRVYQNLCAGCDKFHEEVLMAQSAPLVTIGSNTPKPA